jgi:hypothetical protein
MHMDRTTSLWSRLNPGTAFAAGLSPDPAAIVRVVTDAPGIARSARAELASPSGDGARRLALDAVAEQAAAVRPLHALREALEWTRALLYRELLDTPLAEASAREIATGIDALARACLDGTLPERCIARSFLRSIALLAEGTGLAPLGAASRAAEARFADVPHDPTFAAFVAEGGASGAHAALDEHAYASLLAGAYGIATPLDALDAEAEADVARTASRVAALAREAGAAWPDAPCDPEAVMTRIERDRTSPRDTLTVARRMANLALDDIDRSLQSLDAGDRAVVPEPTPGAMEALGTEGEEYLAGGLTDAPRAHCFITAARCGSLYTLANVLFHELAHCWNMLACSRGGRDLPAVFRVAGTAGTALLEGIATRREREIFELFRDTPDAPIRAVFDECSVDRRQVLVELELDTEYWWLARVLRSLFDFRVQSGRQPYIEFVRDMSARTGLSSERVHSFCFSFFERPGYAPCYAVGARSLAALFDELSRSHALSRREFDTRAAAIGMVPPALWRERVLRAG